MQSGLLKAAVFFGVIGLIALLYRLTLDESVEDPCAGASGDIGSAVLADEAGDQDALVNRAIIVKGKCKQPREGGAAAGDKTQ